MPLHVLSWLEEDNVESAGGGGMAISRYSQRGALQRRTTIAEPRWGSCWMEWVDCRLRWVYSPRFSFYFISSKPQLFLFPFFSRKAAFNLARQLDFRFKTHPSQPRRCFQMVFRSHSPLVVTKLGSPRRRRIQEVIVSRAKEMRTDAAELVGIFTLKDFYQIFLKMWYT